MIPTKLAFETRYADDSGVQFGVSYDANKTLREVRIEHIGYIEMPTEQLDWLIESLTAIRNIVNETKP